MPRRLRGIWSAVLTPIDADLTPDASRAIPSYRELLEAGCDGINLLGTTGEAMSFSADQRAVFMEALASSGIPMERMMVGTGAASLRDTLRLTRLAFEFGFAAALVMPPFFFRDASDDGILAFFDALFARANPPKNSVLLYNFPRMSGITFRLGLVNRLLETFPEPIAGMKDSSNDAQLQSDVIARHPSLAIFPGSERDLLSAKRRGVAGCISGSVALWPQLARAVFMHDDSNQAEELRARRATLEGFAFIPAVRYLMAKQRGDSEWERPLPPLLPLTRNERRALDGALAPFETR
jgi:4-hydroxy-tetrahydrodipicolinate synthase